MSDRQEEDDQPRDLTPEELEELATRIHEAERRGEGGVRRAFEDVPFVEETAEEIPDEDELKP